MLKNTTMNFSGFILCIALLILGSGRLFGQVSGTKTIPTDYATIAAFITDINTNGIGAGGVVLNVPSGYTETAPAGGFSITATGTVANPIVIQGTGGAPKPIITASNALTAGALNDGVIKLIGSDYITISGLELRENAGNTTTTAGTNNMTEWGIALAYASTTDGCRNVSILNNTIALGATYQNAFGIYANSTHAIGSITTSATATTGNNNNLVIKGNTISGVNLGIVAVGPTAAVDHGDGLVIGGALGDGNSITFGVNATFSGYVNISGTVNGILVRNIKNTNCSYNTLVSSGTVTNGTLNGIQYQAFSNTPTGTFSQVISNNIFDLRSASAGSAVVGITAPSGSATTTSTFDVSNNQFNNFGHTVASPTGALTFISTGCAHFTTTINNNSFNNLTVTTTGSVTFVSHSFTIPAGGSSTASNNTIGTQFTKSGAGGSVVGFTTGASSPNSAFYTLSNNNFSNINVTGGTSITFINNTDGSGSACSKTITGNTFSNIMGGTSAIIGFSTTYWGGATSTVGNNTFINISGQGSITGINIGNTFAGTVNTFIQNNTISSLSSTGTGSTVTGITTSNTATSISIDRNTINGLSSTGASLVSAIAVTGSTNTTVSNNKVYGLSTSNAGGTVFGISVTGGAAVNVFNNVISGLTAPIASGTDVIRGININSSSSASYGVYYNSVYLNASSTGTNFGTTGIYHQASATASTAALDMRNNIIINESTPAGTGLSVAFRRSAVQLNNFASSSNKNLLYAGIPSAANLIMYDGTTSYQTMAPYQGAVLPREANSFTGESAFTGSGYGTAGNFFINLTGASSDFLRPVAGIVTQVEGGASPITSPSITTDFTGAVRPGTPDIGAYEFSGTTPAPVITLNSVTPPTSTQCVAVSRLVSVNITTASGTITGATIGYSINGVPQTNIVMTNVSGATWEGTIPVPTPANATITWGVAAVNSLGINGGYTGTPYFDEPLFGATISATASSPALCSGTSSDLTASIVRSGTATVGNAALTTGATEELTAFCNRRVTYKQQTVYTAADLTAAGLSAGPITSIGYTISTVGDAASTSNFTVKIGTTALSTLTDYVVSTGFTLCRPGSTYNHAVGLNTITLPTPFVWDGTSNIIVEVTHGGIDNINNAQTFYTTTAGNTVAYGFNGAATGTLSNKRFNTTFVGNTAPAIQTISWSDGVGTVGTTNPLTVSPTATTTYTATITAAGCAVSPSPSVTVTVNPLPTAPTAANSVQCGTQIPTASVTSTSGLPTPSFKWYDAAVAGTLLQSGTSTTYTTAISATTTFYVSELNTVTGCESARVAVTVTVSTPDAISASTSAASICDNGSVTLTAANTNPTPVQTYTYSWVSNTGSGAETPIAGNPVVVTPTLAGTYTYTVTATDGGCVTTNTISVIVNPSPTAVTANSSATTICNGSTINLTSSANSNTSVAATLTEGFETFPPSAWTMINAGSGNAWSTSTLAAHSGASGMGYVYNSSFAANAWAITPQLYMVAGQTYNISFWYKVRGASFPEKLKVTVGNAANVAAQTSTLWDNNGGANLTNTTWVQGTTSYTPGVTGTYYVGFNCYSDADEFELHIDDVSIQYTAPGVATYSWSSVPAGFTSAVQNPTGVAPAVATTYTVTATNSFSCSASASVAVTVNQPTSSSVSATSCYSYTWPQNGTTYVASGAYTATIPNAAGCDSVITLNLTINNRTFASVNATGCSSYTWAQNGTVYNASGSYNDTITNAAGCDSVVTLNLTINQPTAATVSQTACQTYTWPVNGMTYVASGTYTATIMNAAGCDSVITLNLTIGGPSALLVPMTACVSYTWPQTGMTYFVSGAYNDTVPNMYGCDSVITLSLTINQPTASTVIETACTSYTWAQNGMTYVASGLYNDTIPNAVGCDSVITLNLTINQPTTSSVSVTECTSYTWAQNGMTYLASGAYTDTIPNAAGCDSIITLNLTINQVTTSTVTVATCSPTYTWAQNGTTYNASGSYNDTITNAAGCDSIVTLNLTITPFVATATDNGNATITASAGTTYQWINCTSNTAISGATAQTFAPTANGTYAVVVSNGTCSDTSNCVNISNVGIKENTFSAISVYPNPTHDMVIVTMDATSAIVEVMDIQGKLIQTTQIKSGDQVDLSTYERGVYTLRIKTEFGTSLERIVKN